MSEQMASFVGSLPENLQLALFSIKSERKNQIMRSWCREQDSVLYHIISQHRSYLRSHMDPTLWSRILCKTVQLMIYSSLSS